MRCSFNDQQGNIRTVQGYVLVQKSTFSYSSGDLVKDDFQLQGNGELIVFDGYVPCPTAITSITVAGQEDPSGTVSVSYEYTGEGYQVKYRLDNNGDYAYALADEILNIGRPFPGGYSIEIIPVCVNGFEGTGLVQDFVVTLGQTCNTVITSITIDTTNKNASANFTGAATSMQYQFDGGPWIIAPITQLVSLSNLSAGAHTINMVPICSNSVLGTGFTQPFTITSQPSQSVLNWFYSESHSGGFIGSLSIYINGVLTINQQTPGSGSIVAPTGSSVKIVTAANRTSLAPVQTITDDTTGTIINTQTGAVGGMVQYFLTPDGDTIRINSIV